MNGRFHLVGLNALILLLERILRSLDLDQRVEWAGMIILGVILFQAVTCGILGMVFDAASGRSGGSPLLQHAASLFIPVTWLMIKIWFLLLLIVVAVAAAYRFVSGGADDLAMILEKIAFYADPLFWLVKQTLALYAIPWCIRARENGKWGPHLLPGLKLLRMRPLESTRLIAVLIVTAALVAIPPYSRGFEARAADPNVLEAGILFVQSYLVLVVVFGASLVVLSSADPGRRRDPRTDDAESEPDPSA
jgi:hypothetical protein